MKVFFIISCTLLIIVSDGNARIINVPSEIDSIQGGINIADNGDTVLVDVGTYYENINFNGKNIVVGSLFLTTGDTSYISRTIIDGDSSGSVVIFGNGEDSTAVLSGFTITNGIGTKTEWPWVGYRNTGGGIYCLNSSPNVLNLIIIENTNGGGLIKGEFAKPNLFNVKITNNNSSGILFLDGCAPNLKNVKISYNNLEENGSGMGRGIFCSESNPVLSNVEICYNIGSNGGGIYFGESNPVLSSVTVHHNIATESGGGIYFNDCTPSFNLLNRCNIFLNVAGISGNDLAAETMKNYQINVDTFTVSQPLELHAYPLEQFSFNIQNNKIVQVAADLYIDPVNGDDNNNGITSIEPLKTITMGIHKVVATEDGPCTLYLANGQYTPINEFYFPLFLRNHLYLVGESRDGVVLDGEGRSLFSLTNKKNISLKNITVTGCVGNDGTASLRCYESEISIKSVIIKNNQGNGVWIRNWSIAYLDSCLITNNIGNNASAIDLMLGSEAIISNTIIEKNSGVGIYIHDKCDANLENVLIQDNDSKGIICNEKSILNANNISVLRNQENGYFCDGSVSIVGSSAYLSNCEISNNIIEGRGGGLYIGARNIELSTVELSSVKITNNIASYKGGGIYIDDGTTVVLSDVTVSNNRANICGGGIYFYPSAKVKFDSTNKCNVYQNHATKGKDLCAEFYEGLINVVLDTFTVIAPTSSYAFPLENFNFFILHGCNITEVNENDFYPMKFNLHQNFPNPFNPSTKIKFDLPKPETVTIEVYNIIGQKIQTLLNKPMSAGYHEVDFNGQNLSSGVYLYKIEAGEWYDVKKMVLLH